MNVFEDLIVELKQENLLEQTVIEPPDARPGPLDTTDEPNKPEAQAAEPQPVSPAINGVPNVAEPLVAGPPQRVEPESRPVAPHVVQTAIEPDAVVTSPPPAAVAPAPPPAVTEPNPPEPGRQHDAEFFKKRAVAEVSSLQMVDHVLTGVEREYMKVVPATFDDFNVKKALNIFLKAVSEDDGNGHAEAECVPFHFYVDLRPGHGVTSAIDNLDHEIGFAV